MNSANHTNRTLHARNPRTGEIDYSFEATSEKELVSIVTDLRAGQPFWAAMSLQERTRILSDWADLVSSSDELLKALVTDTGRYFIASAELGRLSTMIKDWLKIGEKIFAEQIAKQSSASNNE
jgi:acyl-CoA reductase-like NAD-dependent aldehyde dehydrogenase